MLEQDVIATLLPLRKIWSSGDDLTDSLGAGCQTRKQNKKKFKTHILPFDPVVPM
jgi:hypothetical protein